MTSKKRRFYEEVETMRTIYDRFPLDRLRQIVRTGTIKEYVAAAKHVLREREKLQSDPK